MSSDSNVISAETSPGSKVRTYPFPIDFDATRPVQSGDPVSSVRDLFRRTVAANGDSPCLGWRPSPETSFQWWTYDQNAKYIESVRCSIAALGLQKGDRVGIYARNCPQWSMVQYAILSGGMIAVPIYDTLGADIVEYVCNHAGVKLIFVSATNYSKLDGVRAEGKIPTVENVVVISHGDIIDDADVDACAKADATTSIMDFCKSGSELSASGEHPDPEISLDDTLVIMYTSGTTGNPKGVVLSHRNFVASVSSALVFFEKWNCDYVAGDTLLSYLPLSHIFEQQAEALIMSVGGKIGFYSGDIKLLLSDMEALKPTVFAGVPRVFARFQQRIEENVESSSIIKKMLFNWGYGRQLRAEQSPGVVARSGLWDSLVFNKVRGRLLPNARLVITGSAPMSSQTNDFLKICLNCPVAQGYGLTETVGGMTCSVPRRSKSGNIGGPLPGVLVKLADLPEMGYLSTDKPCPRGEICVKGDFVFSGYYENEEATAEAFDEDGFFKTGDVGQWLEDGSLQIIDRAKNLFKLSQGEYVSPEALEQEYAKAKLVLQIFVYGNSLRDHLVAVVVPDGVAAEAWGEQHGVSGLANVATSDEFKREVLEQLEEQRVKCSAKKYEAIKDLLFEVSDLNELGQGFHVDNNLMTPSFKLRRPQLKERYAERLDALYDS